MPLYEYQCQSCSHRFERIQKFSDAPVTVCPVCGGAVEKLVSSPAFQFKGSGWYITDYARKPEKSSDKAKGDGTEAASAKDSSSEGGEKPAEKKEDKKDKPAEKDKPAASTATTKPSE
jgi:putative FmdB family regulatory protein